MSRLHQILIGILAIQVVLGIVVFWPRVFTSEAESGPLLADFKASDVVSLTISDGEGNRIALEKSDGAWVLPEAGDFPADGEKITPLLEKIEGLQANRLVTRTEASHKRLKVAGRDFNRRLELTMKDGRRYEVYVGSSAGASATHVRAGDQSEVYLTDKLNAFDANARASSWIDTLYYRVPVTATVSLTLVNGNGTLEFERVDDKWAMPGLAEGQTLRESSLTTFLNQVTSMRMTSPIGKEEEPSFGLAEPLATVTLKAKDGEQEKTYTLRVGARTEDDNNYVVHWSDSPYYVRVSEFTGDNLIEKTRDDFIEPAPTPESEGGTTE